MTANRSSLKRAYDAVALFALLNLVALGGLVTFLVAGGAVDGEKLRRIVGVLRGEDFAPASAQAQVEKNAEDADATAAPIAVDAVAESQMDLEIMQRESERIKTELEQRLALNNSILLRVMNERESFQQERKEATREQEAALEKSQEEGFQKQIDIYESLAPKIAVQHLLAMPDPDEAAKVLLEINTRKAKAIVEAAKRGEQMERMKQILQRVRDVAPERSAELESEEQ